MGNGDEGRRNRADRFSWGPGDVEIIKPGEQSVQSRAQEGVDATRERLAKLSAQPSGVGKVALKHADGRSATLTADESEARSLRVVERDTDAATVFAGPDELIKAGWMLD